MGMVYFDRNVVVKEKKNLIIETRIKRTDNKHRQRADASKRHGIKGLNESKSNLDLVDSRDFEWLAWNYRTYKLQAEFQFLEVMILTMFN